MFLLVLLNALETRELQFIKVSHTCEAATIFLPLSAMLRCTKGTDFGIRNLRDRGHSETSQTSLLLSHNSKFCYTSNFSHKWIVEREQLEMQSDPRNVAYVIVLHDAEVLWFYVNFFGRFSEMPAVHRGHSRHSSWKPLENLNFTTDQDPVGWP